MKHLRTLAILIAMLWGYTMAHAEKVEIDGIWYNLVSKAKQAEVTSSDGTGYSGSITIPATVTHNGVEYSVTSIGERAFSYCRSLTTITIPESVTSIEASAFSDCSSLESITIPESVTSIGKYAFSGCSSLESITIPESVTSIGYYAFSGCSGLAAVHISSVEAWCNIDFADSYANPLLYAKNLYLNGDLVTELVIPDGVTSIGDYAFYQCSSLTSITIPNGVTSIGNYAFYKCSSLTSVTISEGVTSIGNSAFRDCTNLTTINIPASVTSIGKRAFLRCSNLTSVSIPEGVTNIGDEAFGNCSSLAAIVLSKSIQNIGSGVFANCPELTDVYCYSKEAPKAAADAFDGSYPEYATLHVPTDALENYQTATPWNSFGKIETFVAVEEVLISHSEAVLYEGQSLQLTATVLPSNADNKNVIWRLVNENGDSNDIVSVDETGLVTAKSPGVVGIIAMVADGFGVKSNKCLLEVKKITTSITLNHTTAKLFTDETLQLTATAHSEDADDISCTWESSSPIAVVNDYGLVTPLAAGEVTITATANDGSGVSASCALIIEEPPLFTITFLVDGEVFHTAQVVRGSNLREAGLHNITPEPKTGYTFSGWSEMPETMPAHDIVVSGTYIINKYRVTFKIGEEVISSESMEYGSTIVVPEAPEREGYTFDGWGEVAATVPAGDVTYEGTYTVNIYKVYYYVGEELVHTAEVAYGESIPEYVYETTVEGDEFMGWIGETYETMPAHDVTYTANITNEISQSTMGDSQLTIYDLNGRKIQVNGLQELSKGIYIINGKKVVIK